MCQNPTFQITRNSAANYVFLREAKNGRVQNWTEEDLIPKQIF